MPEDTKITSDTERREDAAKMRAELDVTAKDRTLGSERKSDAVAEAARELNQAIDEQRELSTKTESRADSSPGEHPDEERVGDILKLPQYMSLQDKQAQEASDEARRQARRAARKRGEDPDSELSEGAEELITFVEEQLRGLLVGTQEDIRAYAADIVRSLAVSGAEQDPEKRFRLQRELRGQLQLGVEITRIRARNAQARTIEKALHTGIQIAVRLLGATL